MINTAAKRQLLARDAGWHYSASGVKGVVGQYFDHPGQKLERSLNGSRALNLAMGPGTGQSDHKGSVKSNRGTPLAVSITTLLLTS